MVIKLTKEDILWLKEKYPNLKLEKDGFLNGEVEFYRTFNDVPIKSSYFLEINLEPKQRSILPQIKEVHGEIEKISKELNSLTIDLHINKDNTICLCIDKKERDYFPNGFFIKSFFKDVLEPYLYWISFYRKYKKPPWDDYAHGELGYLELYAENSISIDELKEYILTEKLLIFRKCKGHYPCFCGSGRKLRDCHKLLYNSVYKLKNELHR